MRFLLLPDLAPWALLLASPLPLPDLLLAKSWLESSLPELEPEPELPEPESDPAPDASLDLASSLSDPSPTTLLGMGGTDVTSLSGSSPPSSLSQSSGTSERLFGWTALEFSRGFPDLSYHLGEYMMPSPCIRARLLRAFFSSGQKVTLLMAGRTPHKPVPPAGTAVVYCEFSHRGPKYPTSSVPGTTGSFEYIGGSTASSPPEVRCRWRRLTTICLLSTTERSRWSSFTPPQMPR